MKKRTSIAAILGMGMLLVMISYLALPATTHADGNNTYEVSSPILNIRSAPANDAQVIGQFVKGNQLATFKEQNGWVQTYHGGEEAWVAKHHLISVSTTSSEPVETAPTPANDNLSVTIAADSVNVRAGAGTNYLNTNSAYAGETFDVISTDGDWYKIKLPNGDAGWIASWLTTEVDAADTNENSDDTNDTPSTNENYTHTQPASSDSLEGYTIVIDAGHGGKDSGAIGLGNVYEKDIVSSTSTHVVNHLKEAGANVITTRTGDYFVSLDERVRISNNHDTDAYISLHYDSFPMLSVNGVATYYTDSTDRQLANSLHSSIASSVELDDRGTNQANFKVLRETNASSVLLELGFISNQNDMSIVQTDAFQSQVASAITNGLIEYFQ